MQFTCTEQSEFPVFLEFASQLTNVKLTMYGEFDQNPDVVEKLILSKYWPKAVSESSIVKPKDTDAILHRSKSVINYFVKSLTGKKFLDFGCGAGHCVEIAKATAKFAIGFDIVENEAWKTFDVKLTTNFDEIKYHGPYDVILLYDVFDHVPEDQNAEMLKRLATVSNSDTIIKVRCHPWTSIHGGHLYEKLNRAYAHLFLTDEQIAKYQTSPVRKIIRPMQAYNNAWAAGGFEVVNQDKHEINWNNNIGKFFQEPDTAQFLYQKSPQKLSGNAKWQKAVLPIEFIDFILKKK